MSRFKIISIDQIVLSDHWHKNAIISKKLTSFFISEIFKLNNFNFKNIFISVEYSDNQHIQMLNFQTRNINAPTDVLSFQQLIDSSDLFINMTLSYEKIKEDARKYQITFLDRLKHVYLHGILHCFGFDHVHENDRLKMEAIEKNILKQININPYLD
jgi:probable rRNA maturation factor